MPFIMSHLLGSVSLLKYSLETQVLSPREVFPFYTLLVVPAAHVQHLLVTLKTPSIPNIFSGPKECPTVFDQKVLFSNRCF